MTVSGLAILLVLDERLREREFGILDRVTNVGRDPHVHEGRRFNAGNVRPGVTPGGVSVDGPPKRARQTWIECGVPRAFPL